MAEAASKTTKKRTTRKKTTARKKATRKKAAAAAKGQVRVKQVKSEIGQPPVIKRTLRALGLRHHQDVVTVPDNPSTRGMTRRVERFVRVEEA